MYSNKAMSMLEQGESHFLKGEKVRNRASFKTLSSLCTSTDHSLKKRHFGGTLILYCWSAIETHCSFPSSNSSIIESNIHTLVTTHYK